MCERQFLQAVSQVQQLCWLLEVCDGIGAPTIAVRVAKRSLLILNHDVRNERIRTGRELRQMITQSLQRWCEELIERASAINALDEHTVDHVIDVLYGCWLIVDDIVAPAAQAIIVETVRRCLTGFVEWHSAVWYLGNDVIALSQKPDCITITLNKDTEWVLQTPRDADQVRQWIVSVRDEIMSRVSGNVAG